MKRAQIQLDEEVYELLRHRAFKEKKSIAGVIREKLLVKGDILYCSCQEGKRKNFIFYKNSKL